jgi:hypothetical protein
MNNINKYSINDTNEPIDTNTNVKPAYIHIRNDRINIRALFDTGASAGNYISDTIAGWLTKRKVTVHKCRKRICSVFNDCKIFDEMITHDIVFFDSNVNKTYTFKLSFTIIPQLSYDMIIGARDMNAYPMLSQIRDSKSITVNNDHDSSPVSCMETTGDMVESERDTIQPQQTQGSNLERLGR